MSRDECFVMPGGAVMMAFSQQNDSMPWLQLSITTGKLHTEQAETALLEHGACSITYRDADDAPILEPAPGETPLWENSIVTGLFESSADTDALISRLHVAMAETDHSISSELLEDQNWERAWMAHFKPMQFGERFWVVPSHHEVVDASAVNLQLDPGLAFGTGTHPTTAMCLQWLGEHPPEGDSVLDYGCGSGILAIAALLLGASHATGTDIDPQAIEASRSNAELNQISDKLQLALVKDFRPAQYDIVLANILSGPLAQLAPTLAQNVRSGGDIVLSGILQEQADSVREAYAPWFDMDITRTQEDWVMLHGCRKHD